MKKTLLILLMALGLAGVAGAGNRNAEIRTLVSSYKGTPGFDVVDLRGPLMGLTRAVLRSQVEDEEDRAVLELFSGLKRLTVVDFSEAAPERRESFFRKARQILSEEELLMEARDGDEGVYIYGMTSGDRLKDVIILCDDALISIRGTIRTDQIGNLTARAGR